MTNQSTGIKTREITATTSAAPQRAVPKTRSFYVGVGVFAILLAFAGFAPSLIDHSRRFAPPQAMYVTHGITNLAWLLLFLAQATLVARGRVDIHRRLGWVGPAIAAAMMFLSFAIVIDGAFRPSDLSGDVARLFLRPGTAPLTEAETIAGIWGPIGVLLVFVILVALGLWFRHRAELHKRFMVFALVPLAYESLLHLSGYLVGRVPVSADGLLGFFLVGTMLLLASVPIYEKVSKGRVHPASIWIPVAILVWSVFSNAVLFRTAPAFKLASWMLQR